MKFKEWLLLKENEQRSTAKLGLYPPLMDALGQYPPLYSAGIAADFVTYYYMDKDKKEKLQKFINYKLPRP